jgi:flagellin-like hook-associated protein FlgL
MGFFSKKATKEEVEQLKQAVQTGFNSAKQDIGKLSVWVKHLDSKDSQLKYDIFELQEEISRMKEELESLRNLTNFSPGRQVFKQKQTVFNKQTAYNDVLNSVQTDVQTGFLDNLSVTERAIIYVLLNSDMKLSYEDLAAMLGKDRATIRGQVNVIRQKNEGLIEEVVGENNKKRVYIPEKVKEVLLKSKKIKERGKKRVEASED